MAITGVENGIVPMSDTHCPSVDTETSGFEDSFIVEGLAEEKAEQLVTGHRTTGLRAAPTWAKIFTITSLAAVWVSVAVAAGESSSTAPAAAPVLIENAWVRAMPPSQPNTAAYMTVRNEGEVPLRIIAASSEPRATVEIHTSRQVDGMLRMEQLQGVTLNPGELVSFSPGGMHLMMLGLNKMPVEGEQVKLCLQFDSGAAACAYAEVRRVAPSPDDNLHQNHQHHQGEL